MARGKASEKGKILERQLQALELRKSGWSYRKIGEKLGVSYETARLDVECELKLLDDGNTDKKIELRQLELERLDKITSALDHWIEAGSVSAISAYLRAMERRAKLLGLDAPEEKNLHVDLSKLSDDELRVIAEGKG